MSSRLANIKCFYLDYAAWLSCLECFLNYVGNSKIDLRISHELIPQIKFLNFKMLLFLHQHFLILVLNLTRGNDIHCYISLAVRCGKPEDVHNAVPVPEEVDLVYGEEYVYSCLYGYESFTADMVTYCTADGSFSLINPPNCTGMADTILIKNS